MRLISLKDQWDRFIADVPAAILRGAWDSLWTDRDAAWLCDALRASPLRRDIKLAVGTHVMHLEAGRTALYREVEGFLKG